MFTKSTREWTPLRHVFFPIVTVSFMGREMFAFIPEEILTFCWNIK